VPVPDASADRIAAIRAAALRQQGAPAAAGGRSITSRRAILLGSAAAVVGAVGGVVAATAVRDDQPEAAAGPPTEPVTFVRGVAAGDGTEFTGKVINHTWGVELLLDATGFPVGAPYRVVYVDVDDGLVEAGGFVGASKPIACRCNAALLRDRISAIEIRDGIDAVVGRAVFA
jgi:hypothetical protein